MTRTWPRARLRDTAEGTPSAGDHYHSAQLDRLFDADALAGAVAARPQAPIIPPQMSALPAASAVVYNGNIRDYVLSADGLTAYVVGIDGTVRAYSVETGHLLQSWAVTTSPGGLAISPDGGFLVIVEQQPLSVTGSQWETRTTITAHRIDLGTGAVTSFPFVATGYDHAFADVEILADGRAYFTQSFSGSGHTRIWALDFSTAQYGAILNGQGFYSPSLTSDPDSAIQLLISVNSLSSAYQTLVSIEGGAPAALGTVMSQGPGLGVQAFSAEAGLIVVRTNSGPQLYNAALQSIAITEAIRPVLNNATGFAFDADGENLFVVDAAAGAIVQISTGNWQVVQSFDLPNGAFVFNSHLGNELLVGPDARYFLIYAGATLMRIDNPTVADAITGTPGVDALLGTAGDDVIIGYQSADTMTGLAGDDRYHVDSAGDIVVEAAGGGTDTVTTSVSYVLAPGSEVEVLRTSNLLGTSPIDLTGNAFGNRLTGNAGINLLHGGDGNDELHGRGGNDRLYGNGDADVLNGGTGNDRLEGGAGNDTLNGEEGDDLVFGDGDADMLNGGKGNDRLEGGTGDDTLSGDQGDDLLDGGDGADTANGGAGNDGYFVDALGDSTLEAAGGGADIVWTSVSYALTANQHIEILAAANAAATDSLSLTGNSLAQTITGNAGANTIDAGGGNDTLIGEGGADTLIGGAGNDLYRVEEAGDSVVEAAGGGFDAVYAVGSYALATGSEVEVLSAIDPGSTAGMTLIGNEFANYIYGNAGVNTLIGGGGADFLVGGGGADFYRVEEAGDVVVEAVGGGSDAVYAVGSYTLAAGSEVELLCAIDPDSTAGMTLIGNEFANSIFGNAGSNTLIGGGGADTLIGGAGNDFYRVETAGDMVIEGAGGGFDSIYAVGSYTLAAGSQVELLAAVDPGSTAGITLIGNEFANYVYGNAGANTLIGGGGADTLIGGGGNDFYRVEEAGDAVVEGVGGGFDSVYAVGSYTLGAGSEIELLSAIDPGSAAAMTLIGNEYANSIFGNAGVNTLIGGGGADTLVGGAGNDFYRVEEAGDAVVEGIGGGFDSVYAVGSYTLAVGSEIELLAAIDPGSTAAMSLAGNEVANSIYGNSGANVLDGKSGSDLLTGGGGADTFAFTATLGAGNADTIADFATGTDRIALDDAIFTALGGLGALNPNAFVTGAAAADADDRIVYNQATGQLFYDADGNGVGAAILFATLQGAPALTASDFQVI